MPDDGAPHPHDTAALHRTARIALLQGRATIERTKELIEKAKRLIASKIPTDEERDS